MKRGALGGHHASNFCQVLDFAPRDQISRSRLKASAHLGSRANEADTRTSAGFRRQPVPCRRTLLAQQSDTALLFCADRRCSLLSPLFRQRSEPREASPDGVIASRDCGSHRNQRRDGAAPSLERWWGMKLTTSQFSMQCAFIAKNAAAWAGD